jgi:RNA polymerase sigma-70 factor, ECF subfamily
VTDAELIAAMRAGDTRAGDRLARRYHAIVMAYFREKARVDLETAAELTQTTLMHTIAKINRFRGDSPFRAYVMSIAWRIACNHFREVERRPKIERLLRALPPSRRTTPLDALAALELREEIETAVLVIPACYRSVVTLWLRGYVNAEIAVEVDAPENTVRSRLSRGLALLRPALARTYINDISSSMFGPHEPKPTDHGREAVKEQS